MSHISVNWGHNIRRPLSLVKKHPKFKGPFTRDAVTQFIMENHVGIMWHEGKEIYFKI